MIFRKMDGAPGSAVFARSMPLLRAGGMWPPPDSAPPRRHRQFAAYRLGLGLFLMCSMLGEGCGIFTNPVSNLERTCQNICSALWRLVAACMWWQFGVHVTSIQVLVTEVERLARVDHGLRSGLHERVAALQLRARKRINRIILGYLCWFTYSSTGVVSQPFLDWLVTGKAPPTFLSSHFWLLVGPDTPLRAGVMALSQSVSQFTCTVVVVGYITFFGGVAIFLAFQARILGLMLEDVPYSAARWGGPEKEPVVRNTLRHCIVFHQDILNAADELNRVLRLMLLLLFMVGLAFIATMIYQISVVPPNNSLFMATIMILICSNSLVGVFCYSSDQLREATEDVVHRVMASDWTSGPEAHQRLLEFVVFRAGKPSALWCWRALTISRVTWLQVLNKSYSVFAVLRS